MGRLIDGVWSNHDLGPDEKGHFVRRAAKYKNRVSADGSTMYPAEAGRYHLYVSYACGWSHRTILFRSHNGLQDVVSVSFVLPFMGEEGWTFAPGADTVLGKTKLYEVYLADNPSYTGRASVPVLWDRETKTIVANESFDICRSFDSGFGELANDSPTLFPDDRNQEIEEMIRLNYDSVQNGVYKCGFASSQSAHETASRTLFERLEQLEDLLGRQRYLLGDSITAADWYLFPTLYRFDSVYYIHFKCSYKQIRDYPNLWGYTRELYQQPGVAATCNMEATREHYYTSHESIHPRRYIPIGPVIDFDEPHGRGT